jgi:LacI family transcriptional regulator
MSKEKKSPRRRHPMVYLPDRGGYLDLILRGVVAYAKHAPHWQLMHTVGGREIDLAAAMEPGVDGMITKTYGDEYVRQLRRWDKPVVLFEQDPVEPFPVVRADNVAVGGLAYEHLSAKGLTNYAFIGPPGERYARDREAGLLDAAMADGHRALVTADSHHPTAERLDADFADLEGIVRALPRPVGLLTDNSTRAERIARICWRIGIRIPEEIALLGVDDDELLCEGCLPPLSAVDQGTFQIGYQAAALLDDMMRGQSPPADEIFVAPTKVVERQSTEIIAVDDPDLIEAMEFIRQYACEGISSTDVADGIGISRRKLEMLFHDRLDRTPHQHIITARLDTVKRLLRESSLPIAEIAEATGFGYPTNMSKAFKREIGMTPRRYRDATRET